VTSFAREAAVGDALEAAFPDLTEAPHTVTANVCRPPADPGRTP